MFVKFQIPQKASEAIHGLKPYQQAKVLRQIEDKIRLLFTENSHNLYLDIHNYASFDNFLNSFNILENNGCEIVWFYDEENLREIEDVKRKELDNNASANILEIGTITENSYINKLSELENKNYNEIIEYFSSANTKFWKDISIKGV